MSTYSLSGAGSHAISTGTTAIRVAITTLPAGMPSGRANPANHFDIGLLRFSDGTAFADAIPITGGPQWIGVPIGTTSVGYSMLNGAVVSVDEVIGGSSPAPIISTISPTIRVPNIITPASAECIGLEISSYGGVYSASSAFAAANLSVLVPLRLNEQFVCTTALVHVGSTAAGHWDIGIYDSAFALLAHTGSVLESGTTLLQTTSLSITLEPGTYWLAFAADSTSLFAGQFNMSTPARFRLIGARTATTNFPLANTPSLSTPSTSFVPGFGISRYTP